MKKPYTLDYGIGDTTTVTYNKEQEYEITEDGQYIVYGYTKDKGGEISCSIQINKKTPEEQITTEKQTITSATTRSFPLIGYKKAGVDGFVWTKSR